MYCRLWFWTFEHPPRIIAHGDGDTIRQAMSYMFAPIGQSGWKFSIEDGDVYLRRGNGSGYCGQEVRGDRDIECPRAPKISPGRAKPVLDRARKRLEGQGRVRPRLERSGRERPVLGKAKGIPQGILGDIRPARPRLDDLIYRARTRKPRLSL